jgi:hypothetical protein
MSGDYFLASVFIIIYVESALKKFSTTWHDFLIGCVPCCGDIVSGCWDHGPGLVSSREKGRPDRCPASCHVEKTPHSGVLSWWPGWAVINALLVAKISVIIFK